MAKYLIPGKTYSENAYMAAVRVPEPLHRLDSSLRGWRGSGNGLEMFLGLMIFGGGGGCRSLRRVSAACEKGQHASSSFKIKFKRKCQRRDGLAHFSGRQMCDTSADLGFVYGL